jgi:UDP-GlcNAc:undecaprenyl-phosphate/decaprenyl-phosphate GlcNAc-1-phosphate transferase
MLDALINFAISAVISLLVIQLLIPLSGRIGLLDKPDDRKQHSVPTPPVGGFGVFFGIVLPALLLYGITRESLGFTVAALLLVLVGALDDRFQIHWKVRIAVQMLVALVLVYGVGLRAAHVGPLFGFGDIELGWLSVPFTVFITVGLINALNMFDGIDGLVGTVCAAVTVMFICAALYSGANDVALGLFWVLGALAGFLWFNLRRPGQPQARVFLGDAGSGMLGFTLAFVIFKLTQNPGHPVSPVLGPYLLAPPIIDGLVLIVHRIRLGKSPFAAGRDHGHHLMLDAGFSVSQIVLVMTAMTLLSGLFGALCMRWNVPEPLMVMAYILVVFLWFWITGTHARAVDVLGRLRRRIYG